MKNSDTVWDIIDEKTAMFTVLNDEIREAAELGFRETGSTEAYRLLLETQGSRIETNLAGIPTALSGKAGKPGQHGSTFGGNPLACAVARAALMVLTEERMIENAERQGAHFIEGLKSTRSNMVREVRGRIAPPPTIKPDEVDWTLERIQSVLMADIPLENGRV